MHGELARGKEGVNDIKHRTHTILKSILNFICCFCVYVRVPLYVCLHIHMYIYLMHTRCPQRTEKGVKSPGTGGIVIVSLLLCLEY